MTAEPVVTVAGRRRLAAFLAHLSRRLEHPIHDEAAFLAGARAALRTLVRHDDWLEEAFARPSPERYQQYLLYCDPQRRFSVVSFVWGPGQRTPIHDHATWGLVGMLRGAEVSEFFDIRDDGRPDLRGEERLEPGEVLTLSPRLGDVHRVRNAFEDRISVSIHVYGADIGSIKRHVFAPEGGAKSFVSGYANHFLPNPWGLA